MKRILSLILATLMCLSCFSFGAGALSVETGNNAAFELGSVEAFPGDTISVPVVVSLGAEANSVGLIFAEDNGSTLDPLYDEDVFTFVGFDQKNAPGAFFKAYDNSKQSINLGWNGEVGDADSTSMKDTQICVAKFKIADDAPIDEYTINANAVVKLDSTPFECDVIPATVTVKGKDFTGIKVEDATFPYNGEKHNIKVTYGTSENVDGIATSYEFNGDAFDGAVDAGTYDVVATITAPGYNKVVKEATLKINKKELTVSGKLADKEYDGTTNGTWEEVPTLAGVIAGDNVDITYATQNQFAKKAVGTKITVNHGVELVGDDIANYNLKSTAISIPTAKITAKAITVTADNKQVRVGGEMPKFTYTVTPGLVAGETNEDVFTGSLKTSVTNTNKPGVYSIVSNKFKANSNYSMTFVAGKFTVLDKEVQDITLPVVEDKTYGDAAFELVVTEGTGTTNDVIFTSLTPDVATVDGDGKVTIVGAGSAKIEVTKAGDDTYADFEEVVTFTVAKKQITITAHNKTAMIGDAIPEFTYDVVGLVGDDTLTGKLATTAKNTNTEKDYPINQGTLKASANYTVVFNAGIFSVIDKILQEVIVVSNKPDTITYGDGGFTIVAMKGTPVTESSITFASDNDAVATVNADGKVTIIGAGKANITVAKAGNDLYADFSQVIEVIVNKVEITVNAEDKGKRVDGVDPELTYTYTGELVGDDRFTGALARETGEDVDTYDILQGTLTLGNNYNITFNKGTFTIYDKTPQTITVNPVGAKTYGDAVFQLGVNLGETYNASASTTYASSNEAVVTVANDGKVTITGAGTAKITVAREGNADLADFSTNVTVTVAKKAITVKADAKEKYVGQDTPELTYTYEGELVGDDGFNGALTVNDGDRAGRTYDIKIGNLSLGDNYKITYVGAKLSVLAKLSQTATFDAPTSATYGQTGVKYTTTKQQDASVDADFVVTSSNEAVATVDNAGNITIKGAGKTTLKAALPASEKYNAWSDTVVLTIAKREITITADDKSKKVGNADPEFSYTLTDTAQATLAEDIYISFGPLVEIGLADVDIVREAGEEVGTYDIKINSFTLPGREHYDVTLVKGTFTIFDKEPQTITGVAATYSKTFGNEAFTLTPASTELPATTFTYASDNEDVVMIGVDGTVTIIGAGTANVTVTAEGNEDYATTSFKTIVTVAPKTITAADITLDLENGTSEISGALGVEIDLTKIGIVLGEVGEVDADITVSNLVLKGDAAANYVIETGAAVETTVPKVILATVTVAIPEDMAEQGTVEGAGTYLVGTEVTLTAVPAKNYKVSQWSEGETKLGTAKTYSFTIDRDYEITLTFKKASTGGGGGGGATTKPDKEEDKPDDTVTPENPDDTETPENPDDNKDDEENKEDTDVKVEWKGDDHYEDIKTTDWYFEAVKTATELGLMNGMTEEEFAPEEHLTRAMLITVLHRFDGETEHEHDIDFEDVNLDYYYGDALIWAVKHDIVMGVTETEFAPDDYITREQMAAILFRYAVYKGMDVVNMAENLEGFFDAGKISEYAVGALNWAVGAGLFEGREDGTLAPLDSLTRAEAATLIVRFTKLGMFAE